MAAKKAPKSIGTAEAKALEALVESSVETIVVGAGASGLLAARTLQKKHPDMQILVLEAADKVCVRLESGFHLVRTAATPRFELDCANTELAGFKVRWERQWMNPSDVDWQSREWWSPNLPQWQHLFAGTDTDLKTFTRCLKEWDVDVAVKTRTPVRSLKFMGGDTADARWRLETPETIYFAKHVIWAAGLTAFQNAVGKKPAQKYLAGNPLYVKEAADYRGCLCMELRFQTRPQFVEGLSGEQVVAIPVRHNSKLYLLLAGLVPDGETIRLKTAAHLPQEILNDPKELVSFQKSIRRTLKNVFVENTELPAESQSRWVVEDRGPAHLLGTAWALGEGIKGSLEFVGEESLAAARSQYTDVLAALDSVNSLSWLSANPTENSTEQATELQVS